MRIVELDKIRNQSGAPLRLGVIGSCRVHHPVQALVRAGLARLVALPLTTYTHTPHEAAQYLRHSLGAQPIPTAFQTYILGEGKVSRVCSELVELVKRVDAFVVEICSASRIRCGAYDFQANYFIRNFVRKGGSSHLKWWREVSARSLDRSESIAAALESRDVYRASDEEILRATTFSTLDFSEFVDAMDMLIGQLSAEWLFVSHINVSQVESRTDWRRERSVKFLTDFGEMTGHHVFDPTGLVSDAGRESSLGANGKDITHYNREFELVVGKALMNRVAEMMKQDVSHKDPRQEQGSVGVLNERDLAALGRLPGTTPSSTDTWREIARSSDIRSEHKRSEIFWREILQDDPHDVEALNAIADIAAAAGHRDIATIYLQMAGQVPTVQTGSEPNSLMKLWPALENLASYSQGMIDEHGAAAIQDLFRYRRLFRDGTPEKQMLLGVESQLREAIIDRQKEDKYVAAARIITLLASSNIIDSSEENHLRKENIRKSRSALKLANNQGLLEFSEGIAEQHLELGGRVPLAWWLVGGKALRERRYDAAKLAYRRCVELRPDYARFHFWAALVAIKQRRYLDARCFLGTTLRQADPVVDVRISKSASSLLKLVNKRIKGIKELSKNYPKTMSDSSI